MGGSCACFQGPSSISLKTDEIEYFISNETFQDISPYQIFKSQNLQISNLRNLSKRYLVIKYLSILKSPSLFTVPYPNFNQELKSIESEQVQNIELDYGEYRTTPTWGEFVIPMSAHVLSEIIYIGEWNFFTKLVHGTGTSYNLKTHEKYSGNFKNGKRHGLGRAIFPNGNLYEGEFFGGEMNGNGTLVYLEGKVYIGEFRKGFKEGYGKEQDRHDSCYEGEYVKDKRSGHGKLIWADGMCYVGDFCDDKMNGVGECWWGDGKTYYGQWANNKMHGEGECTWPDGREYQGQYFKDLEDGYGIMKFSNGEVYEGNWKNGKQNGSGTLHKPHEVISGQWLDGHLLQT